MTVPINKKNLKKILKFNSSFNKYIIYEQNFYNKHIVNLYYDFILSLKLIYLFHLIKIKFFPI